ncbi:hypothetical protein PS723_03006 [Pseudomonas fluorescens]|uniref:Uncharacterized protein n=1 Tax=Pseudomonas fluorescens TaxID=294 RepID=A0A5E7D189_PSEFL|nr:hypothetical protein PS723_03006 [Pseudomonas fluorescens]
MGVHLSKRAFSSLWVSGFIRSLQLVTSNNTGYFYKLFIFCANMIMGRYISLVINIKFIYIRFYLLPLTLSSSSMHRKELCMYMINSKAFQNHTRSTHIFKCIV